MSEIKVSLPKMKMRVGGKVDETEMEKFGCESVIHGCGLGEIQHTNNGSVFQPLMRNSRGSYSNVLSSKTSREF